MSGSGTGFRNDGRKANRYTVRHLFLLVPWIAVGFSALKPITDNSFLWHIRAGTMQLDAGRVLTSDPFSFTFSGEPWRTQSWLLELGYGWLEQRFGLGFVPVWILSAGVVLVLAAGLILHAGRSSVSRMALGLVLFGWMISGYMAPRPVLISYAWLALLVLAAMRRQTRWTIPLLLWLWAATHGSFILGIGYLALEALRRRQWDFGRLAVLGVVLASLTAHGWHSWEILARFLANGGALKYIVEWAPPRVLDIAVLPFFVGLIGIIFQAMRGKVATADLWVIAPFLLYGLTSYRALMPAMIVLLSWMVPDLPFLGIPPAPASRAIVVGSGVAILLTPLLMAPSWGELDSDAFPLAAAQHLDSRIPTVHDDSAGGYLIYARGPDLQVYADDRAELYGEAFIGQLGAVLAGSPVWIDEQEEWRIGQALLDSDDGLARRLLESGWSEVYSDDLFVVLKNE